MPRDPRYDVLFEPVRIGPHTARNRFYQVPHCTGMGRRAPTSAAVMRGVKAEGGWAVVCTEQCDIHHTADVNSEIRLWDERDIPMHARMTDLVHRAGSLAGVELVYNGYRSSNQLSREVPMAPSARPHYGLFPAHARAMTLKDIAAYRRWHRTAALNARRAGFDIVYVYAGHDLSLPMHFLSRRHNQRTDAYGGSLENRMRLLRELLEDTHDAVGDTCAVALRIALDELLGPEGIAAGDEGREIVEALADVPDLWDVNVSEWDNDSQTSRFAESGYQERYIGFVKSLTTKPVVGVGRYTSPDAMVSLVRRGVLDFIGAARPSIADPFLPRKIEEGRPEDIRECIGCNVCVAVSKSIVPIHCTQNPTMGEEWRRGWHPERLPEKDADRRILVVGAGPAGLEAARALGARGYAVALAEATRELGGRVGRESRLPGLAEWARVRDYRVGQIERMPNVEVYRESEMTAADVADFDADRVAIATGASWRRDGTGREHSFALAGVDRASVYTPDDLMDGRLPEGRVLVYDDDHAYMGGVVAELLRAEGREVVLVTPETSASAWTTYTLEHERINRRLREVGVEVLTSHALTALDAGIAHAECVFGGGERSIACDAVVLVTALTPNDTLAAAVEAAGGTVHRLGDCLAPGTIAAAVWQGHRFARELDAGPTDHTPFQRENTSLEHAYALPD